MAAIPTTYQEAISLVSLLTVALGFKPDQVKLAVHGQDLHVGVIEHQIHFLAGRIPPENLGKSEKETIEKVNTAWLTHVVTFDKLRPSEREKVVRRAAVYNRLDSIAAEFVSRGITPPRLLS